jgi:hypothetical protein
MKGKIFLSYARSDGRIACDFFLLALQNAGYRVWRDLDNLAGGDSPWQKIEETIRGFDAVLLFVTQGALDSPNVEREWKIAMNLQKRIIPLRLQQVAVPTELVAKYTFRDITDPATYQLEPSRVQHDLETERTDLRDGLADLRTGLDARIPNPVERKYLEPFAEDLRRFIDAEPTGVPREVFRMLCTLLSRLIDELAAGNDITSLVETMAAGTYSAADWAEEPIYKLRAAETAQLLKKVRDAIPSIPVNIVVVAMTRAEADNLESGRVFENLPPEWRQGFDSIRSGLPTDWLERYGATSEDWVPFAGAGCISFLIGNEIRSLNKPPRFVLRSTFVDIRSLPEKPYRQTLLGLRESGCLVVLDAISAWHPHLQASFRNSSLDVSPTSMVVRVSPHETLDSVLQILGFLLREWLSCEFFQRANIDLDEKCATVMQLLDFRRWIVNRLRQSVPGVSAQKSEIRPFINNLGG